MRITLLVFLSLSLISSAQNENDLFRYSKTSFQGTARFDAMGGAFGALGADISSATVNPAGYGRYSSSAGTMSFYFGNNLNTTEFQGEKTNTERSFGGLSNFGVVICEDVSPKGKGIMYQQFGIGITRIENFKNSFRYTGTQFESLLDEFAYQAAYYYPEELNTYFPFSTDLAYTTGTIAFDDITSTYYSLLNSGDMTHDRSVRSNGGISEFNLSYSLNYLNKLYFGLNWGIRPTRYSEHYDHSETLTDTSGTSLRSFTYSYDLQTRGSGSNLKIGAIYLINNAIRVGFAIHSPTFLELEDTWSATMTATFKDHTSSIPDDLKPTGNYKYRLRTPSRIILSGAYVFGTKGCISTDLELMDYRHAHFRTTTDDSYAPYNYIYENAVADTVFTAALNLHLGGEYVVFPGFFIRAGAAFYGNAYKQDKEDRVFPDLFMSTGVGYRFGKFSLDASYKHRFISRTYYAFYGSSADLKTNTGMFTLSGLLHF